MALWVFVSSQYQRAWVSSEWEAGFGSPLVRVKNGAVLEKVAIVFVILG